MKPLPRNNQAARSPFAASRATIFNANEREDLSLRPDGVADLFRVHVAENVGGDVEQGMACAQIAHRQVFATNQPYVRFRPCLG